MTFSDPEVAAFVNRNFVSAWTNRGPGFFNADFSTEKWIFSSSMEAYPTKNICTFFLSPDGKVFNYLAGYYGPDLFLKALKTAADLRQALFDEKMQAKAGGLDAARKIHGQRALLMAAQRERVKSAEGRDEGWRKIVAEYKSAAYRGQNHTHSAGCLSNLRAGLDYLARLHQAWSETAELPDLEEVRYAYLWGNPFTEEAGDSKKIEENDAAKKPDPYANAKDRPVFAGEDYPTQAVKPGPRGVKVATGLPDPLNLLSGK